MRPRGAFETGPLLRGAGQWRDQRGFDVFLLDAGAGPRAFLGQMLGDALGYRPDADLLGALPELAAHWPRNRDAAASRRAIGRLGSWGYCRECQHPQLPEPCACDWCASCELRAGASP